MSTKIDLINDAYSQLRISGLTVQPTPEDISKALERLEDMAEEWESRDMCIGFNFEESPDPNSASGVQRAFKYAVSTNLAVRLIPDFNKPVPPQLIAMATQAAANVSARTARPQQTNYPGRQPRGSGTTLRFNRWRRFYPTAAVSPVGCDVNRMRLNDVDDFFETWDSYLLVGEDVASYTLTAEAGLAVVSQSLSSPRVNYRIRADGTGSDADDNIFSVTITVTTTTGRVDQRVIQFIIENP